MLELRDYQRAGIEAIRSAYQQGRKSPCYVLPTGGGKSILFGWMVGQTAKRGRHTCILVHRDHLLWQLAGMLDDQDIPFGIIAPGFPASSQRVQIASVATLVRRLDKWPHFDWLVVDEAHHAAAKSWGRIVAAYPTAKILGVTATPSRLDGKGLGRVFDDLLFGPSMATLINTGYLSGYRIFAPPTPVELARLRTIAGDYDKEQAAHLMDNAKITGDAVEHYRKHLAGAPSIAFGVTVAHAHHVADRFREAGYTAAVIEAATDNVSRQRMLADLANGRLNVLSSCEVVSEGTDVPVCQGSILLRPTKSLGLYLQQCGRALRPKPTPAIILDHAGNSALHGPPAMDRTWTLADGAVKAALKSTIKTCPECFAVNPIHAKVCEVCGESFDRDGGGRGMPNASAVELIERAGMSVPPGAIVATMPLKDLVKQAKTLEQLKAVAKARGYKERWAEHTQRARDAARERWLAGGGGHPYSRPRSNLWNDKPW